MKVDEKFRTSIYIKIYNLEKKMDVRKKMVKNDSMMNKISNPKFQLDRKLFGIFRSNICSIEKKNAEFFDLIDRFST